MITIDPDLCRRCGVCTGRFGGYCIASEGGAPAIDYDICNQCQKCVAICPHRAISMNGVQPAKLSGESPVSAADLREFLSRRRSCKLFKPTKVPREILLEIAGAAAFAPNQNKNIEAILVDDEVRIAEIDRAAMRVVRRWYRVLFSVKPFTWFFGLFSKSLPVIKKKMELDLLIRRRVVKENAACLALLTGDARVPVTEASAQYLLCAMGLQAEALGVGSCLMDSVKLAVNQDGKLKSALGIPKRWKVLGVLALGYSAENLVNIPRGYEIRVSWNKREQDG